MKTVLDGVYTALVTPLSQGTLDFETLDSLIDVQIQNGIQGLVPCGSTGEGFCLTPEEQKALIQRTVEQVAGRVPVIAGTSGISTEQTIFLTQQAQSLGADAALIVPPPYVRLTPEALVHHYEAVIKATQFPIIIYNNPGRTPNVLDLEVVQKLAQNPFVIGMKDSTEDMKRPALIQGLLGDTFPQISGEDALAPAFWAQGGQGWISVVSNVAPALCVAFYDAWTRKDHGTFKALHVKLTPLMKALCLDPNPVAIKCALALQGYGDNTLRPPLLPAREITETTLRQVLKTLDLLGSHP